MNFNDMFDDIHPSDTSVQFTCYGDRMKRSENLSNWNIKRAAEHEKNIHWTDHIKINFKDCFMRLYETGETLIIIEDTSADIDDYVDIVIGLLHDYHPQITKIAVLKISFKINFKSIKNPNIAKKIESLNTIAVAISETEINGYTTSFHNINRLFDLIKDDLEFQDDNHISPYNTDLYVTI